MGTAALRYFAVPAPKTVVIKCMGNVLYTLVQCFRQGQISQNAFL